MIDKEALDAAAAERAESLGQPHVVDGTQPYHAGALVHEHVPGNVEPSASDPTLTSTSTEMESSDDSAPADLSDSTNATSESEAVNG